MHMSCPDATGTGVPITEGSPRRLQPCPDRPGRMREAADELGVAAPRAVGRLTARLLQIAGGEPVVEAAQQRAVMDQRTAPSSLGVPRNLPPIKSEIGPA